MTRIAKCIVAVLSLIAVQPSRAVEPPAWQAMLGDFVKAENAGYGGLCGVAVDPTSGRVWINVSDRGFYRSDDQAQTFRRCGDMQPKGRTETPGCLLPDPTGASKRMLSALVYGSPVGVSADEGATWKSFDGKASHIDWCAVDWTDPEMKFVLALKHEAGGLLLASHDGGATFAEIGRGFGTGWVFSGTTAVVAEAKSKDRPNPNLLRTIDGGKTWNPCGAYGPVGTGSVQALPKWRGDTLYWLVEGALIASSDQGATWNKVADVKDGRYGPVFGRDAKQLFLLTAAGVVESLDGGATWLPPIAPPPGLKGTGGLTWLAYDPKHDVLYVMKMTCDLYRLAR